MGMMQRLSLIFRAKANKALTAAENPNETLDLAYEDQLNVLQQAQNQLVKVVTARKGLEIRVRALDAEYQKLGDQARQAMAAGREDLAREALTRQAAKKAEAEGIIAQYNDIKATEDTVTAQVKDLKARIQAFASQKETAKAKYSAAQAQATIGDSFAGLNGKMADAGLALQRANEKTAQLTAHGAAVQEMVDSGALSDPTGKDDLTRQLEAMSANTEIESSLAALRAQVGSEAPKAIEGSPAADAAGQTQSLLPDSMRNN